MKNRLPLYPNRRKIAYTNGTTEIVTIDYADEPTEAGTPLNKATLLDDTVAQLMGLSDDDMDKDDATVNNALNTLYNLAYFSYYCLQIGEFPKYNKYETFLQNGEFTVPNGVYLMQAYLVGGGGGGGTEPYSGYSPTSSITITQLGFMGGGGGYTKLVPIKVTPREKLNIIIGEGGEPGVDGEASFVTRGDIIIAQALGGKSGNNGGMGGSGGGAPDNYTYVISSEYSKGGIGGTDGSDGGASAVGSDFIGGKGQGTTTRDFGEDDGELRAQGGAGGGVSSSNKTPAIANSGNGGNAKQVTSSGGSKGNSTAGSSGIVLLRWIDLNET